MAEKGKKRESGQTSSRTVLQLEPVKYKVTLSYLGHDRIATDPAQYRCKYELQRGETAITAKPELIPNSIRSSNNNEHAVNAATPGAAADRENPPGDPIYRIMMTDNHGMRSADELPPEYGLLGRGGAPDGDTESKPANYQKVEGGKRDWMPDIKPAIPLRVVVRKYIGATQVDLDKTLKAVLEIKDPVEEFQQNDGVRRRFLEGFFNKYNRTDSNPDPGDDDASNWFGPAGATGMRIPSHARPGVKATDVLKQVPYGDPPVADIPPAHDNPSVQYNTLTAATAHGDMNAKFDLSEVDDSGTKIGVADLAFCPWPTRGDNSRFLVTLIGDGDQDVRETKENGADVQLLDDADDEVPKPRAYTTGRFVIWKRLKVKLVILVNRTGPNDIQWNNARSYYRKTFVDLVPADNVGGYYRLVPVQWIAELKNVFTDAADQTALDAITTAAAPDDLESVYRRNFFPKCLTDKYVDDPPAAGGKVLFGTSGLIDQIEPLARSIITHACQNIVPAQQSPDSAAGKRQEDSEGFYVMLIRPPTPTSGTLGASFGDRMFWFVNRGGTTAAQRTNSGRWTTSTFAHELGHALYLRHSHTSYSRRVNYRAAGTPAPPPPLPQIRLVDGSVDSALADHDQADAYACLMGYTRHLTSEPCGVCALTLRFYDRVKVQASNRYQNQIMSGLNPVVVCVWSSIGGTWTLAEQIPNLAMGSDMYLFAVGQEVAFTNRGGSNLNGRVNITTAHDSPVPNLWTASPAGRVTLATEGVALKVTGTSRGAVTVTYRKSGLTAQANFTVT